MKLPVFNTGAGISPGAGFHHEEVEVHLRRFTMKTHSNRNIVLAVCALAAVLALPARAQQRQADPAEPQVAAQTPQGRAAARPVQPTAPREALPPAPAAATAAAGNAAASPEYRLAPGDTIRIQVFQNPDLSLETRVPEGGSISYPLVGAVAVGGLTLTEAEAKIASALRAGGYVEKPQVNIALQQVRGNQVSVLGQVNKPGRFPLETFNLRVSELIALAGGIAETGEQKVMLVGTREGKPFRKELDMDAMFRDEGRSEDVVVQAGDTLYVQRAPVYYIYGEVQKPGAYRIERGMTVQQALAQGGGLTPRGTERKMRLERKDGSGKTVATNPRPVDLVQANDVLYVRESLF
jgi:polysaccharide export outer membrane protein